MIGFGLVAKYFITPNGCSLFCYLGFPTKTLRWQSDYMQRFTPRVFKVSRDFDF